MRISIGMKIVPILGAGILLMMLNACVPAMHETREAEGDAIQALHYATVRAYKDRQMKGKIYLQYSGKKWKFEMKWRCRLGHYDFDLYSSGRKVIQFRSTPDFAELKDHKGRIKRTDNADLLIEETLGVEIPPVSDLCHWLVGLPSSRLSMSSSHKDSQGRLEKIEQLGWQIRYVEYQRYKIGHADLDLPKHLVFEKDEVRITVNIRQWTAPSAAEHSSGSWHELYAIDGG